MPLECSVYPETGGKMPVGYVMPGQVFAMVQDIGAKEIFGVHCWGDDTGGAIYVMEGINTNEDLEDYIEGNLGNLFLNENRNIITPGSPYERQVQSCSGLVGKLVVSHVMHGLN